MPQPAHKRTDQTAQIVRRLSGLGVVVDDIAHVTEISHVTIRKYYRHDIERGRVEANVAVANALFKAATRAHNPSVPAAMFWLRNRGGWKDPGITVDADGVGTLAIEFVAPRDLVNAARATQSTNGSHPPVINGTAMVEPDANVINADACEEAEAFEYPDVGVDADEAAQPGTFEVPLPDEDEEPS